MYTRKSQIHTTELCTSCFDAGSPLKGGGEVVLGKKYSPHYNTYTNVDSFVGELHQVNFWHIPSPGPDYMWNAAHSCSWPVAGNIYPWIAFMNGSKSDVQKKFPSTCKCRYLFTFCHSINSMTSCLNNKTV